MAENRQDTDSEVCLNPDIPSSTVLTAFLQDVGLAREAAYNLSLIFVTTGAAPLAEQLYRRWLSL